MGILPPFCALSRRFYFGPPQRENRLREALGPAFRHASRKQTLFKNGGSFAPRLRVRQKAKKVAQLFQEILTS